MMAVRGVRRRAHTMARPRLTWTQPPASQRPVAGTHSTNYSCTLWVALQTHQYHPQSLWLPCVGLAIYYVTAMLQSDWIASILATWYGYCILSVPDPFLIAKGVGLQTKRRVGERRWRVRDQYSDWSHCMKYLIGSQTSVLYPPRLVPVSPL